VFKRFLGVFLFGMMFLGVAKSMANENRFDSGHVVIPVLHSSGDVHNIAVPEDTPLTDLHSALAKDYSRPAIEGQEKQPAAEGAVENSPLFRATSRKAWDSVTSGMDPTVEAGFDVDKNGRVGPIQTQRTSKGTIPNDTVDVDSDSLGAVHTHPNGYIQGPSDKDIAAAKQARKTVWVVSAGGLYSVDPGGSVSHIYKDPNWLPPQPVKDRPTADDIKKAVESKKGAYIETSAGTWHISPTGEVTMWDEKQKSKN
jgi:hypothetical protein